jgi:uncharacterized protein with HEPN domain
MPRDDTTVAQILQGARYITSFCAGVNGEAFAADVLRQSAVLHQLLIIGEAVKRLSPEFRGAHPDLPWPQIARMRDTLIHRYDTVNLSIVWKTATADIPDLIGALEPFASGDGESEQV